MSCLCLLPLGGRLKVIRALDLRGSGSFDAASLSTAFAKFLLSFEWDVSQENGTLGAALKNNNRPHPCQHLSVQAMVEYCASILCEFVMINMPSFEIEASLPTRFLALIFIQGWHL